MVARKFTKNSVMKVCHIDLHTQYILYSVYYTLFPFNIWMLFTILNAYSVFYIHAQQTFAHTHTDRQRVSFGFENLVAI